MLIEPVSIPSGERGLWEVQRIVVSKADSDRTRLEQMRHGRGFVPAGEYTALKHARRGIVMTDTPDERRDHYEAVYNARGHILINGLGIGMVLNACLKKPDVTRATIVEIDPDVVALVAPHYTDPRVEIVTANAFDYLPPKGLRYGMVWHDIWDDICADNLDQMTRLKRKYGRRTDWQGCWAEYQCKRQR